MRKVVFALAMMMGVCGAAHADNWYLARYEDKLCVAAVRLGWGGPNDVEQYFISIGARIVSKQLDGGMSTMTVSDGRTSSDIVMFDSEAKCKYVMRYVASHGE